ncbi:MAG: hypothetical protein EAX96_15280 [Candidatus Lokiarchaeota archaeon]|nr:hypothetical protein [Candidatus Lokiarchaeota archaeon]
MQIPVDFHLSIITLLVISILCFLIAAYLLIKYINQDPRTHDTLYFISAMFVFGIRFILQVLWYSISDPILNQLINASVTILIVVAAFLITTFFFSIYFKENPKRFQIILAITIVLVIIICIIVAISPQSLMITTAGEYRYEYGDIIIIIALVYLIPATFINFGLFLYISIKKYEGRLRLKSILMAIGLIIWVIAELLGPWSIFYMMDMAALFIILIGFILKKE